MQQRGDQSCDSMAHTSTTDELASELSRTVFSTETTSPASDSDLISSLRTSRTKPMHLPRPTCRLGAVQIEWEGGDIGWRLVALDCEIRDEESLQMESSDVATLRKMNLRLKNERELMKLKIKILLNSIAEQTALVSLNEETLEELRMKAKSFQQIQGTDMSGDTAPTNQQGHFSPKLNPVELRFRGKKRSQSESHVGSKIRTSITTTTSTFSEENESDALSGSETSTTRTTTTTVTAATSSTTGTAETAKVVQFA